MNNELILSDAMRLGDAVLRINLWTRQKNGEIIFKSTYDPDERIQNYELRRNKYAKYVVKHITCGFCLQEVLELIENIYRWLPEEVKLFLIENVKKIINDLMKGLSK
jgi:hypothetical protein